MFDMKPFVACFLLTALAVARAADRVPKGCYENFLDKITHSGKATFNIPLEKNGVLPVGIRVKVEDVYNGAFLVSAVMPKSGRILSEATFATQGEMDFDPRFSVSSIRVTFTPNFPPFNSFRKDRKPKIIIGLYGCYMY